MKIEPDFVVHSIVLDNDESKIFREKLPSDKDVELFIDVITEGNNQMMMIRDHDVDSEKVLIEITSSFEGGIIFSDIKSEIKRIAKDLLSFLNE